MKRVFDKDVNGQIMWPDDPATIVAIATYAIWIASANPLYDKAIIAKMRGIADSNASAVVAKMRGLEVPTKDEHAGNVLHSVMGLFCTVFTIEETEQAKDIIARVLSIDDRLLMFQQNEDAELAKATKETVNV